MAARDRKIACSGALVLVRQPRETSLLMSFKLWLLTAAVTCIAAATAAAHPVEERDGSADMTHLMHLGSGSAFAPLGSTATATSALGRGENGSSPAGPCTEAAKGAMPDGEGHDHADVTQHRGLRCRIEQAAFLPLKKELEARPDVVLGEMDVKADIAAVSVIWPEGGILFFDVKDPAQPKFLSWYRSTQCEGAAVANNCGAFVDLSGDGKTAFIAQQSISFVPGVDPDAADPGPAPTTPPGIEVVDASDPTKPVRAQILPVASQGGVHTARWHEIPEGGGDREPGQYVFGIANRFASGSAASGIEIAEFDPDGPVKLRSLSRIEIGEAHDTFIQNDPDGRTYLYIAGGYDKGLEVYDVTSPSKPKHVARWDLTPECNDDWYAHTVDVVHRNGKRIVTMPAEVFKSSAQSDAEKEMGCGNFAGNGDQPGPLWILDATDFSKLAAPGSNDATIKEKSNDTLIATWTNPAGRAAGNLTFSPHNQQVVGDKIYLSDYHGGVFVLDATGAFAGRQERPSELGYIIPNGEASNEEARPMVGALSPAPTAAPRTRGRSSIWDMVFYKGYILAADQVGGFYSLRYDGDDPAKAPKDESRTAQKPSGETPADNAPAIGQQRSTKPRAKRQTLRLTRVGVKGGRLRIQVTGTLAKQVRRVTFSIRRRRVAVDRKAPFRVIVRRPRGKKVAITARVTFKSGKTRRLARTLR